MSNAPHQPSRERPSGLEALVPYRQQITYALLVAAALLLVYPLVLLSRDGVTGATARPRFYWLVALFLVAVAGSVFNAAYQQLTEVEKVRALLMALGGLAGFATFAFGLALPWTTYREVFAGGVAQWRANPWALAWTALAVLGGLFLMFASLQLARGVERSSGPMRRLLYGFNAVLGTLLLLAILGLLNVLAYVSVAPFSYAKEAWDATEKGLYTLSPASKNLLAGLKKPVKVYVVLAQASRLSKDVEALLENCRAVNNQLSWQTVSRDRDRAEYAKLQQKYAFPAAEGLLVLYGTGNDEAFDFVKREDLFRSTSAPGESFKYSLTAENALMKSLVYLSEGKTHPTIYFTQGAGEMELEPEGPQRPAGSLGELRRRLEQGNYTVKPLALGAEVKAVPADADLVVIARPTRPFTAEALKALRDYVGGAGGKKGRLVVLMDVTIQNGQMVRTGLAPLLGEFNVRVSDGRVLTLNPRFGRTFIQAIANPRGRNPVAQAFGPREDDEVVTAFLFDSPRVVEPLAAGGARGTAYDVEPLLLVVDPLAWDEQDVGKDPAALVAELRKPENFIRWQQNRPRKTLALAVTVAEGSPLPNIPGHEGLNAGKGQPRMVVFGDAGWVSSGALNRPENQLNYDLFVSCLSWLRERPNIGKVAEDKERKEYALTVPAAAIPRIEYLPLGLMLLAVVGAGCGVWVVRRR